MASVAGDQNEGISLNIMPLLDVFSILILFLLMNFSTDPINHDLSQGVELPDSIVLESLDEVPAVIISKTQIIANDKVIAELSGGRLVSGRSQGGIAPLFSELQKMAAANRRFAKDVSKSNVLTLEIDKSHRFEIIKSVMLTAQQAEFIKFKLMVSKRI